MSAQVGIHNRCDYEAKDLIPKSLRQEVLAAKGRACVICGATEGIDLDHIIPESRGGPTTFDNLQPMCRLDSLIKGCKNIDNEEVRAR